MARPGAESPVQQEPRLLSLPVVLRLFRRATHEHGRSLSGHDSLGARPRRADGGDGNGWRLRCRRQSRNPGHARSRLAVSKQSRGRRARQLHPDQRQRAAGQRAQLRRRISRNERRALPDGQRIRGRPRRHHSERISRPHAARPHNSTRLARGPAADDRGQEGRWSDAGRSPRAQLPRLRPQPRAMPLRHRDRPPQHVGHAARQHRLQDEGLPRMGREGRAVHEQSGCEQASQLRVPRAVQDAVAGLRLRSGEGHLIESPQQNRAGRVCFRDMTPADIAAGLELTRAARWNQTERDWGLFLRLSPEGCRVAVVDERVVGTVATARYEDRFGWIGMVLVDQAERGQGIGARLMAEALDVLKDMPSIRLDATPAGHPVYQKLDFVEEYRLSRMETVVSNEGLELQHNPARPMTEDDLPAVAVFDRQVFGADRSLMLEWMSDGAPEYAWAVEERGQIVGYTFGRRGFNFESLGPIIAHDQQTARRLVSACLTRQAGKLFILDASHYEPGWL